MKVSRLSTLLLGSSLLLSVSAFAGTTIKKSLHLYENVTVEGKQLAPGDYKFEWSGSGPDVKIDILKGKETVATVSARVVSQGAANGQDGYVLTPVQGGRQYLAQIFFTGEKFDLEISQSASADTNPATNPSGSN